MTSPEPIKRDLNGFKMNSNTITVQSMLDTDDGINILYKGSEVIAIINKEEE